MSIINLSNAGISLITIDGIEWTNVTDLNDAYYDAETNHTWITFTRVISPGNWNSSINDGNNGEMRFKWRSNVKIDTGQYQRKITFYKNNTMVQLTSNPGMNEIRWENQSTFYYDINNKYTLNFSYPNGLSGNIWIAFPPEQSTNTKQSSAL